MLIRPKQQIIIPKHVIKEKIDEQHRRDWEDDGRYVRQREKALRYIPVRAPDLANFTKLIQEVKRVFHDDLIHDPIVIEAVQQAVDRLHSFPRKPIEPNRAEPIGLDNTEETLASLEWQRKEETSEP